MTIDTFQALFKDAPAEDCVQLKQVIMDGANAVRADDYDRTAAAARPAAWPRVGKCCVLLSEQPGPRVGRSRAAPGCDASGRGQRTAAPLLVVATLACRWRVAVVVAVAVAPTIVAGCSRKWRPLPAFGSVDVCLSVAVCCHCSPGLILRNSIHNDPLAASICLDCELAIVQHSLLAALEASLGPHPAHAGRPAPHTALADACCPWRGAGGGWVWVWV